jgi:hypothetical protein
MAKPTELREPARMQDVARVATAALDRVLIVPSASNQHEALTAVQAYLAATEYLWTESGADIPG